ncbi:outer dense fiber protein 3-like [Octopus sinensis]|uniref:Outer dense fiber protein 3-like n=1 Tax=Octopus sinensis TaxID=2607531 RepID=A0A7E6EHQ8_9MOLL|nr:outer dense fiber protein 3-like [Octopus sinensis]
MGTHEAQFFGPFSDLRIPIFTYTPGPGSYQTTESNVYKHRAPLYSLTSRIQRQLASTDNPSPATYYPNKVLGCAPQISFGIRHSPYIAPLVVETNYN